MSKQTMTVAEVQEAAQTALDNWDWDVIEDSQERQDMRAYLAGLANDASDIAEDGVYQVSFQDIWDDLDEHARSFAMSVAANRHYWGH